MMHFEYVVGRVVRLIGWGIVLALGRKEIAMPQEELHWDPAQVERVLPRILEQCAELEGEPPGSLFRKTHTQRIGEAMARLMDGLPDHRVMHGLCCRGM
ncbi:MAG: hypothetical protein WD200_01575 [Candidatus Andersenbacteria bacterium]